MVMEVEKSQKLPCHLQAGGLGKPVVWFLSKRGGRRTRAIAAKSHSEPESLRARTKGKFRRQKSRLRRQAPSSTLSPP